MRNRISIFIAAALVLLLLQPAAPTAAGAAVIPTFSIVSVVTDTSVTIQTANFPASQTFTVRMGAIGTRGVGGTVVGTTSSGAGGSFQATYAIPAGLKGARQIAIRMDSPGGYFAYNWFNNNLSAPVATPVPGATPIPGYSGIPTFSVVSVVKDTSVTIRTRNFPAGLTFTARMGAMGTAGVGGTVVGTTSSGAGGAFDATYTIPAGLKGAPQIAIRLDSPQGYFAYNWFYNSTWPAAPVTPAPTSAPGPTSTPAPPPFSGIPTFSIVKVVKGSSVTIETRNFPAGQTFTARMGAIGTLGIGGTVVGTTSSAGGTFQVTYNIPADLANAYQVAIRLDSPQGYFAYNWFYNSTWP